MDDLMQPRTWAAQAVVTNHCVVPRASDAREIFQQRLPPTPTTPAEIAAAPTIMPDGKWTPGFWDPTPGSIVFSVVDKRGNVIPDYDDSGYDTAISCVNLLPEDTDIYIQGIATSGLGAHPDSTGSRLISLQVDGSVNTTNTGPHTFVAGDIIVAMFPTVNESKTAMAYGRKFDNAASGRFELETWPIGKLVQELASEPSDARSSGALRTYLNVSETTPIHVAAAGMRAAWKWGPIAALLESKNSEDDLVVLTRAAHLLAGEIKKATIKQPSIFVEMGIKDRYTELAAAIATAVDVEVARRLYANYVRDVTNATYHAIERRIGGRIVGTAAGSTSAPNDPLFVVMSRRATYPSITTYLTV